MRPSAFNIHGACVGICTKSACAKFENLTKTRDKLEYIFEETLAQKWISGQSKHHETLLSFNDFNIICIFFQ